MVIIKNTKSLAGVISKYSDMYIYSCFNNVTKRLQITNEYINDPAKDKVLKNEITAKLIVFREACKDLNVVKNQEIVVDYFDYLLGSDYRNSYYRGIQFNLANSIYRDVTLAANTDYSKLDHVLSASALGLSQPINTKIVNYVPRVECPSHFDKAGPNSFLNATEVSISKVHAAITGRVNKMTGDVIQNNVQQNKPVIVNHNQKNHDIDSESDVSVVQTDVKITTLTKVLAIGLNGNIFSVGATETKNEIQYLAQIAQNSVKISKLGHIDPSKNTVVEKMQILKKIESSGDITEVKNLTGFPFIINSDYTKDPSSND
jgi:hypothetical protein